MDRVKRSEEKIRTLFEKVAHPLAESDPDFVAIQNRFIYGDVAFSGDLPDKTRQLITLVVLATSQTLEAVEEHTGAALRVGATPGEIKEAIYQCAPYIGFAKTAQALTRINALFGKKEIPLPVESQSQVDEASRFEKGLKVQKAIFGEVIDQMRQSAPQNLKHIQDGLSAFCFGDIYTRSGLDLTTREILTLCILITLGGCENQVKAHIFGNLAVGNTPEALIAAITQSLPYIGFPRTLNALSCLNEVVAQEDE